MKKLHLISLDIPYPADYGGVIDIYYRLKALEKLDLTIQLHAFHTDRKPSKELQVFDPTYHPRKLGINGLSKKLPYIVYSRRSPKLLENLQKDDAPILFEGLHSCYYLSHPSLANRLKIVRLHNVEWQYYEALAAGEKTIWKKIYFEREAKLLKTYEKKLKYASCLFPISLADTKYYKKLFLEKTHYLPVFHPNTQINALNNTLNTASPNKKIFALYHGNLGVNENILAVNFLLEKVVPHTNIKWVIAGKNPNKDLQNNCLKKGVDLIANPNNAEMHNLIKTAHINVLPTFQQTGIKLKLLNALFLGQHCLVNPPMVIDTGLETLCHIANDAASFIEHVERLSKNSINIVDIEKRKNILDADFNNDKNAKRLLNFLTSIV